MDRLWHVVGTFAIKVSACNSQLGSQEIGLVGQDMDVKARTDLSGGGFNDLRALGGDLVMLFATEGNVKKQDQYSQEFQFIGSMDRLEYVAGLYYFEETAKESTTETVAPLPA